MGQGAWVGLGGPALECVRTGQTAWIWGHAGSCESCRAGHCFRACQSSAHRILILYKLEAKSRSSSPALAGGEVGGAGSRTLLQDGSHQNGGAQHELVVQVVASRQLRQVVPASRHQMLVHKSQD